MQRKIDYEEHEISNLEKYSNISWIVYRNTVILDVILRWINKSKEDIYILEVGAGSGNIARYLKSNDFKVDASEMYESAIDYFKSYVDHAFIFNILSDEIPESYKEKYDFVVLGDVVEHLDCPISALKKIKQFLKADGHALITVPALKELWSDYDRVCGHKRRYSKKMLATQLSQAGLVVKEIKYFMFFPAILLFIRRKIFPFLYKNEAVCEKELCISLKFNTIIDLILKFEKTLSRYINYPIGSSLIALAAKSNEEI